VNAEVLIKFKGDTSDADSKTKKMTTSLGQLTKAFSLGSLAAQGISKAIQIFSSNLDSAITRVDALNNFPKVMSNLGISAEASSEVIKDLSEQLKGLPTSLDAAAMAVQRFTSKNGNVKESEKIFLAVNNAILAGGASANIQSQAIEQISQAYAKGKPDMMEWRSLMTAMPAQLKQVATAMGYTDAALLGEAVRAKDGEKEFSRMIDTMVRMNSEGVAGFKSFDEQARNATGGISTNITNMKTAFVRGIGNIITSLDTALEPFGGLSGVISKIGKVGEQAFTAIGKALEKVIPALINVGKWIVQNKDWLLAIIVPLGTFIATFMGIKKIISIINAVKTAFTALSVVLMANPIVLIVAAVAALVAGFIYLWNTCEGFRMFWIGLWEAIKGFVIGAWEVIQSVFIGVAQWFYDNVITPIMNFVMPIVDFFYNVSLLIITIVASFAEFIYNIFAAIGTFIWDNFLSPVIDFFVNAFTTIWNFISKVGTGIKNVFMGIVNWIWGNILQPIINFFKKAFDTVSNAIKNVFNGVKEFFSNVFNAIGNIIKAPINGIIGGINAVIRMMNTLKVPDWVPVIGGKGIHFNEIPQLRVGTNYVPEDTLAMIHEGEAVVPKKFNPYANGINARTMGTMQNGTMKPTINVYADFKTDPLGQVVSNIKTFSGGAKNDYNYGQGVS